MAYASNDELAGIFDLLKPVERALRAPVNAVLNVVPGGKAVVQTANAVRGVINAAKGKGATAADLTPAVVAAGAQQVADDLRQQAAAEQARQAAILAAGMGTSPLVLAAIVGLGVYALTRRRANPRRRTRRRGRR